MRFPARLELLGEHPVLLLDGAHNPSGARALADAAEKFLSGKRCVAIIGMLRDKDYTHALAALVPCFDKILTLTPDSPPCAAGRRAFRIRPIAWRETPKQLVSPRDAIALAKKLAGADGAVVVCGSLFLAASLRPMLQE